MHKRFVRDYRMSVAAIEARYPADGDAERNRQQVHRAIRRILFRRFTGDEGRSDVCLPETAALLSPDAVMILQTENGLLNRYQFATSETAGNGAITPEVLGTVFELTHAGRRRTGTYFTPRPIVSHMCRQALRDFLKGANVPTDEDAIIALDRATANDLVVFLEPLRVIDPACGAGAFLVGMLDELSRVYRLIDRAADNRRGGPERRAYILEHHLRGIDIDPDAVEIARMRLHLALGPGCSGDTGARLDAVVTVGNALTETDARRYDLVISNPPYGVRATSELRDRFFPDRRDGSQARDAYGLFVARGLELLRPGGRLSLLVSDTWRTITRHRPLRRRLIDMTELVSIIDLPTWIFGATVNTCILTAVKRPPSRNHQLWSSDLRAVERSDPHGLPTALEAAETDGEDLTTATIARYRYPQALIAGYPNLSIFTASEKLFRALCDPGLKRLGSTAKIVQGMATGDNRHYLRKAPGARGDYREVERSRILTDGELTALTPDERRDGVEPARFDGRIFVTYDKGGRSHAADGWLPNYYVPTDYFIDWSRPAVDRLRSRRSPQQNGRIAARFQNAGYYFVPGLTWSDAGYYSPTVRLSGPGVFDVKGSRIILDGLDRHYALGLLASKVVRFFIKTFENHTVSTQVDDLRHVPLPPDRPAERRRIITLVNGIIAAQKQAPQYPYQLHEQTELDQLVYRLYDLAGDQIREIELWYRRRYPRLASANLPK